MTAPAELEAQIAAALANPGLKVTYPYGPAPEPARYQCAECGGWERGDRNGGQIRHSRSCDSKSQPALPSVATTTATVATPPSGAREQVLITDSYQIKDALKDLGGRWDAARKGWVLTAAQHALLLALVEDERRLTGRKHVDFVAAYDRCGERWEAMLDAKQARRADAEAARLRSIAQDVRRTGLTRGRDDDVREAVKRGYLSESDAMNTDD